MSHKYHQSLEVRQCQHYSMLQRTEINHQLQNQDRHLCDIVGETVNCKYWAGKYMLLDGTPYHYCRR
jgi:hypothetical protein